ncbi:hypothetical protein [Actinacidiphila sp. ITFR-21]|uniref:hypothetical protein n=1 Tax=Actinacidiphila sp. ITFR-21 TaxID=3075199 RepID=UPI00288BE345|nr:hypothetical protein [Streptomyces sp. ITFR-21]WNI15225.1 hypothetical protein RLT57_06530 [Streptomyces sp. ITFR-21]
MMLTFEYDTHKTMDAVTAARRRGLPVPPDIDATRALHDTVTAAAHMPRPDRPTVEDIPDTPEQLAALIAETAHAHRIAESHHQVASLYAEPIARKYNALVRAAVPGWIVSLQPEFDKHLKVIRRGAAKLPPTDALIEERVDWNDPAVSAAWELAQAVAPKLDQIVHDRRTMAAAVGIDGGRDWEFYTVAAFPDTTHPDSEGQLLAGHWRTQYAPIMQEWQALRQRPVARWVHLARAEGITLQLARPNEVRERAVNVERWREANRMISPASGNGRNAALRGVQAALRG